MWKVVVVALVGVLVGVYVNTMHEDSETAAAPEKVVSTQEFKVNFNADKKQADTGATPKKTASKKAKHPLKTLLKFLKEAVAVRTDFISVEVENGKEFVAAAVDATEFDNIVSLPAAMQFNDNTMAEDLRTALMTAFRGLSKEDGKMLIEDDLPLVTLVYNLFHEVQVRREASRWHVWANTLPLVGERKGHGIYFNEHEVSCLNIEAQQMLAMMVDQNNRMFRLAEALCKHAALAKVSRCPTKDEWDWGYATVTSRQMNFTNMLTLFPVIDALPYENSPNVRPGIVSKNKEDDMIAVDFVAAKTIKAGDALTFRAAGQRTATQQLLFTGAYNYDDFSVGVPTWIEWDQENRQRLEELGCYTEPIMNNMESDGSFHDELFRCAQLHVIHGEEAASERQTYDFNTRDFIDGGLEFLTNHATLAINSIPNATGMPKCFEGEHLGADTATLKQIAAHNEHLAALFEKFKQRVSQRRNQQQLVNGMMDEAKRVNEEDGTYMELPVKANDDGTVSIDEEAREKMREQRRQRRLATTQPKAAAEEDVITDEPPARPE